LRSEEQTVESRKQKAAMAKLISHPVVNALQGRIGRLVFVHEGDSVFVRQAPAPRKEPFSAAQMAGISKFRLATLWAKALLRDPVMKAAYARVCHGHLSPFNMAVRDYLTPPVLHHVDLAGYTGKVGDVIRIRATDDFRVVQVPVEIRTVAGDLVEAGVADRSSDVNGEWLYSVQVTVPAGTTLTIEVAALDLPGNRETSKVFHYIPL
jgi:hypothetical protein